MRTDSPCERDEHNNVNNTGLFGKQEKEFTWVEGDRPKVNKVAIAGTFNDWQQVSLR